MGRNNKARRAAKAKARKSRSQGRSGGDPRNAPGGDGSAAGPFCDEDPLYSQGELARNLLLFTATAQREGNPFAVEGLTRLQRLSSSVVDQQAEAALLNQVDAIWAGGWQPAELHRQGRLGCPTAAGGRLVSAAIATDHTGRRSVTLDSRWVAQIESLDLPLVNGRSGWVARWIAEEGFDRATALATIVDAIDNLIHLRRLDPILPPPGSKEAVRAPTFPGHAESPAGGESNPLLVRIRALLAQAESTTFEAEATTFTAKAQELMTRYAIDAAVVYSRTGQDNEEPLAIRIPIDAPYADAKSLLLQTVAEAGRCRAVFHSDLLMSTVVGFPADLAAVELLFTSLLIQVQTALADAAKKAPAGTRTRSQSYRSAFLLAYTGRIGDRLKEINDAVFAEVEAQSGSAFLPVLRSRSASIDDYLSDKFGDLVSSQVRGGYDAAGWASGEAAADRARLNFGDLTEEVAIKALN